MWRPKIEVPFAKVKKTLIAQWSASMTYNWSEGVRQFHSYLLQWKYVETQIYFDLSKTKKELN